MKKELYKWHKYLGLIISIPIILWTLSGMLHPVMGWIKPVVKHRFYSPKEVNLSASSVRLDSVLIAHGHHQFKNLHTISFNGTSYAQIKLDDSFLYINLETGEIDPDVEKRYAIFLARHYSGDTTSEIKSVTVTEEYSSEYKSVNRLLPVYRVELDRNDGYIAFVEVTTGRLGGVLDSNRYMFNVFFEWFHNFNFLGGSTVRTVIISMFMLIAMCASLFGLYIYFSTRKTLGERGKLSFTKRRERNYHRKIGLFFSLSLLCFAFSGMYHIIKKDDPYERMKYKQNKMYPVGLLNELPNRDISNIGLVSFNDSVYFQVFTRKEKREHVEYVNTASGKELHHGDATYAAHLAKKYFGFSDNDIVNIDKITTFKGEYGFINKRLPVQKVQTNLDDGDRFYIETKTSMLGAHVVDSDIFEGLSFAYLHKYHMFDFLGKDLRNSVMMFFAFGNIVIIVLGLRVQLKKAKRQ